MNELVKPGQFRTFTGRYVYPLALRVDDVDLRDIAHALSNQCRFAGHIPTFYSVAQHSVLVASLAPPWAAKWALLHDASEAYLTDLPSPLKRLPEFSAYRAAEARASMVIAERFGLDAVCPDEVHAADKLALAIEMRDVRKHLNADTAREFGAALDAAPAIGTALLPHAAEAAFLSAAEGLGLR